MKPGLNRAVPAGILGFLGAVLFVILLRWAQGLEPLWNAQIGLIMATFASSGAFLWGIGAFNPSMSEHPHEPEVDEYGLILADEHEDDHHEEHEEEAELSGIFSSSIWTITLWTILLIVLVMGVATLPTGFTLQVSTDPAASRDAVGYATWQVPFGGPEVVLSQLTVFVGVIIFTILSLAAIGGIIAWVFYALNRGVKVGEAMGNMPLNSAAPSISAGASSPQLPASTEASEEPEEEAVPEPADQRQGILGPAIAIVRTLVVFVVLYLLFYYVLIGLILPEPELQLVVLSLVNAILFTALILYTTAVLRLIGRFAGWLARVLRGLPQALGQK